MSNYERTEFSRTFPNWKNYAKWENFVEQIDRINLSNSDQETGARSDSLFALDARRAFHFLADIIKADTGYSVMILSTSPISSEFS